jgi:hypothetical protein
VKRFVWWFFVRNAVTMPPSRAPFWMRVIPWRTRWAIATGPLMPGIDMPTARMPARRWARPAAAGPFVAPMVLAALGGAVLAYFFDPNMGTRRRNMARDRLVASFRRPVQRAGRLSRTVGAGAYGIAQKAIHEVPPPFLRSQDGTTDDVTLARKVESEIFRGGEIDKGRINVSVENGIVVLVGEVDRPEHIMELGAAARAVTGVQGVDNLLHLPGTPAPTKHHMVETR